MAQRPEELRSEIEGTRDELGRTLDAIGDRVSPGRIVERRVGAARARAGSVKDKLMGSAQTARERTLGRTGDLTDSGRSTAGTMADAVTSAPDRLSEQTQGSPLVVGALAFGVGFLVGAALPPTETEQKLVGDLAEPIKQELTDAGKQVGQAAGETAKQAVQDTKEAASQAAAEVKGHATDAAQQVKQEASDRASDVTDQAKQQAQSVKSQQTS